jgi:DNA-directed RNA polymerase subunit beta'
VIDPGNVPSLKFKQILSEDEYIDLVDRFGEDSFNAGMGAEAVYELLKMLE